MPILSGEKGIVVRYSWFILLVGISMKAWAHSAAIFISFSMPEASIQHWLQQAEQAQVPIYLRGFIDNSFKKTIAKMAALTKATGKGGILIDPHAFERFNIQKVPAVVFVDDNKPPITVYGNITLLAAAEIAGNQASSHAAQEVTRLLKS